MGNYRKVIYFQKSLFFAIFGNTTNNKIITLVIKY